MFYEEYVLGGKEDQVWESLSEEIVDFDDKNILKDVFKVLNVSLDRVICNFNVIKDELEGHGYLFENIGGINSEYKVFQSSNVEVNELPFIGSFGHFGKLPLLLSFFLKRIVALDFRGNFPYWDAPFYLDAVFIYSENNKTNKAIP